MSQFVESELKKSNEINISKEMSSTFEMNFKVGGANLGAVPKNKNDIKFDIDSYIKDDKIGVQDKKRTKAKAKKESDSDSKSGSDDDTKSNVDSESSIDKSESSKLDEARANV